MREEEGPSHAFKAMAAMHERSDEPPSPCHEHAAVQKLSVGNCKAQADTVAGFEVVADRLMIMPACLVLTTRNDCAGNWLSLRLLPLLFLLFWSVLFCSSAR